MKKKLIVVLDIVGLSPHLLSTKASLLPNITALMQSGTYRKMAPSFPAVTCSVQASLLSGKPPEDHGIVGNGFFCRKGMHTSFWAQENSLVNGPRIWDIMHERDPKSKIAVLFFQNSKYINADIVISPSPLHTDAGMVEWCYSKPAGYYEKIAKETGDFKLMTYWGPMANEASSRWIAQAGLLTAKNEQPDMTLVYIPHLDYNLQRFGPDSTAIDKDLKVVDDIAGQFMDMRKSYGPDEMTLFVISEYGMVPVKKAVCPNRVLREAGLLKTREIAGREYIDFELSGAFAVVDHQIAHVYCNNKGALKDVEKLLRKTEGVADVLDAGKKHALGCNNARAGDLMLLANRDAWFAYYYWTDDSKAPFYARTVDIHNKPGYDPVELFVDMQTRSIPLKPEMVRGSHGLPAKDDEQMAVMLCSDKSLNGYAPQDFSATQFLAMLYRVM